MKKLYKEAMLVSSSMFAGMVLGLMIAPSSGKETRKNMGKYVKNMMKSDCCEQVDDNKTE